MADQPQITPEAALAAFLLLGNKVKRIPADPYVEERLRQHNILEEFLVAHPSPSRERFKPYNPRMIKARKR